MPKNLSQLPPPPQGQTGVSLNSLQGLPPPPQGQQGMTLPQLGSQPSNAQPTSSLADQIWSGLAGGAQTAVNALGVGNQNFGQALGNSIYGIASAGNELLHGNPGGAGQAIQEAGAANAKIAPKAIGDVVSDVALPASLAIGGGTGASVASRIGNAALKYGGTSAALGAGQALSAGKDTLGVAESAGLTGLLGAAGGAVAQGASEAAPWVAQKATQLLSKTSNTPEEAFNVMNSRPAAVAQIGASPEGALKNTQGVVRGLRTQLTQSWQQATDQIAQEFEGQRVGLPDKLQGLLDKVDGAYSLDNIPQNTANMSANELIKLQGEVNSLANKPSLKISPEGVPVRKLADQLKDLGVSTFGGENGSYATLYKNYSTQKGVFDAANDIVRAYQTGKPITQTTALARVTKIFEENRPAYLQAMKDLESATGQDVLSKIAASGFKKVSPSIGGSVFKNALEYLALPLTSPRFAGAISRGITNSAAGSTAARAATNFAGAATASAVASQVPNNSPQ